MLTMLIVIGLAWNGEYNSCRRQAGVREAAQIFAQTAQTVRHAAAQLDLKRGDMEAYKFDHAAELSYAISKKKAMPLSCGRLFPDTQ